MDNMTISGVSGKSGRHRGDGIDCVFLTCFRSEFSILATVLQYSRIRLHRAETLAEADFLLTVTGSTVLVSDILFLDGAWQDALEMAADLHPLIACLLAAEPVDGPCLAEAGSRGACAILWKPIDFIGAIDRIRTADQAARDRALLVDELPPIAAVR